MPETKSKFLIPAAAGAALFVVGGIAAYMYLKGGPTGDISGALGSAKIVPDKALMATYVSTDPKVWAKLQQFGTPEAQKLVTKGLEDFNKQMLTENNISYEKDIQPWIGGVMIAVLPPNPTRQTQATEVPSTSPTPVPANVQEPNILMVVGIKDKLSALNLAKKLKSEKGVTIKEIDYKGEKITETKGKGQPTYSAVLNNTYLLLAPSKQGVEQAIDTYKGQPSFANKEGAKNILAKGLDLQNTVAQIYVPDYAGSIKQLIAANPQTTTLPPQSLEQLKQVKSMVAGVGIDDAGVRMKAIANLDPQLNKYQYQNSPSKIVGQFPAETIALMSGQGINRWWTALVEQSKDYPDIQSVVGLARTQTKTVNIDLDKEVFGWMDGEFGFAAVPSNQGVLASVGFGGAFVFHTSDRKTAETTLGKLDNLAKLQSVNIAQRNIGGKNVTDWQIPNQGALLSHGWLDNDTVFVALGGPVADAIAASGGQSLENSQNFKTIAGSLQKPNGGYFYLDMDKTLSLVNRYAAQSQPIDAQTSAILNSIRGFGLTAISPDKSTTQVEMLLALKKSRE